MKKRLWMLLGTALCLILLLPASVLSVDKLDGIPQTFRYAGSEYECISFEQNQRAYHIGTGTAYVLVAKSGSAFYALGSDLNAVGLRLQDGVLSAESGVAEIVPEPSETRRNFTMPLPAKIGSQYLTITDLNGPLALSDEQAFVWYFTSRGYPDPLAVFYGSVTEQDTSVSGMVVFADGAFTTVQNGRFDEDNISVYLYQKVCPHTNRQEYPAVTAACTTVGNDAHAYCPDCGSWLNAAGEHVYTSPDGHWYMYGEYSFETFATGHHYVNGVCTHDPSHIALDYEPVTADMDLMEEGCLYILAYQDNGNNWKVMNIDPENQDYSTGCTGIMGADGKLRIDNTNDGPLSAAEFRLTPVEDEHTELLRVPIGAKYGDGEGEYPWGLWAPDNGSDIFRVTTDSGYLMMDARWAPGTDSPHPYSVLVREDGIAEMQMLTFTHFVAPITYSTTSVYDSVSGGERQETCFHPAEPLEDTDGNYVGPNEEINVRLFRAKVPALTVRAQIQNGAAAWSAVSDVEREAVIAVGSYDADGRLMDLAIQFITLKEGMNESSQTVPEGAAECRVFLLDETLRPLAPAEVCKAG